MALLSVIIPSFNEESNIRNTVDTLSAVLQREHIAYELLFVSDGSKDQTFPLIRSASLQDNRVRGVQFSRNFGKEAAIFAGLRLAEGDCCVVIDCDLQHPPETIPRMYRLWEQGYEVVEGIKSSRGRGETVLQALLRCVLQAARQADRSRYVRLIGFQAARPEGGRCPQQSARAQHLLPRAFLLGGISLHTCRI